MYLNYYENNGPEIFYTMICRFDEQKVSTVTIVRHILYTVYIPTQQDVKSTELIAPKNLYRYVYKLFATFSLFIYVHIIIFKKNLKRRHFTVDFFNVVVIREKNVPYYACSDTPNSMILNEICLGIL